MPPQVSFIISAVDKSAEFLDGANKRLKAMHEPAERLNKQWGLFLKQSGLESLGKGMRGFAGAGAEAWRSVSRIVAPLSAITGAASIAGLYKLVEGFGEFGSKLEFTSARIGVNVGELQALQGAARLAGGSASGLTQGLTSLGQTMNDAIGGRAPEAQVLFNTLGISIQDAAGHARNVAEVLPEVADKIAGIKDPFQQARIATMLFGGAAEDMLPFLREGSAGMARYTEMARRYGVVSEAGAEAANRLRQAHAQLGLAVEGLGNSIAEKLAPIVTPLLTDMADWIAANREWIATGIGDAVRDLAAWLHQVDWHRVGADIKGAALEVKGLVDRFGGVKGIATDVMYVIGGVFALKVLGTLFTVGRAVFNVGRGVYNIARAFGALGSVVKAARAASGVAALAEETAGIGTAATAAQGAVSSLSAALASLAVPAAVIAGLGVIAYKAATDTPEEKEKQAKGNAQQYASGDLDDAERDAYAHPMTHFGAATDDDRARWDQLAKDRAARGETFESQKAKQEAAQGPLYQSDRTWSQWWGGEQGQSRQDLQKKIADDEAARAKGAAAGPPAPDNAGPDLAKAKAAAAGLPAPETGPGAADGQDARTPFAGVAEADRIVMSQVGLVEMTAQSVHLAGMLASGGLGRSAGGLGAGPLAPIGAGRSANENTPRQPHSAAPAPAEGGPPPTVPKAGGGPATAQLMAYYQSQGWTKQQAAGITANLTTESALRPDAVGDHGAAYGIGQWHKDRQAEFAKAFGHDIHGSSLQEQAAFVQYELKNSEARAGRSLAHAGSAAEAGAIVSSQYERPADRAGNELLRGRLAEKIAAAVGDGVAKAPAGPAAPAAPPVATAAAPPVAPAAAPVAAGAPTATASGKLDVSIRHSNVPQGTTLAAQATGPAFSAPPRVETAMAGLAA